MQTGGDDQDVCNTIGVREPSPVSGSAGGAGARSSSVERRHRAVSGDSALASTEAYEDLKMTNLEIKSADEGPPGTAVGVLYVSPL